MKRRKDESAAIVTVKHADRMTRQGRRRVAAWLRRQAGFLERHGDEFAGRFTARYLYAPRGTV